MFGAGLPVELQNKFRSEPSFTIWLSLYDVILGGTERKEYDNVWLWYRLIITDNENILHSDFKLRKVVVNNYSIYIMY